MMSGIASSTLPVQPVMVLNTKFQAVNEGKDDPGAVEGECHPAHLRAFNVGYDKDRHQAAENSERHHDAKRLHNQMEVSSFSADANIDEPGSMPVLLCAKL